MTHTEEEFIALTHERDRLRNALIKLVELDDLFKDEENGDRLTFSGAYYAFYKGQYDVWKEARAALADGK